MNDYKRVFIVDTSNIVNYDFVKLMKLDANDLVYLFISPSSRAVPVNVMMSLQHSGCGVEYGDVEFPKQSISSLALAYHLGTILRSHGKDTTVYIVTENSNFTDFCSIVKSEFKLVHLTNETLNDIKEGYSDDEEVSIFPAYKEVHEMFNKENPSKKDVVEVETPSEEENDLKDDVMDNYQKHGFC